jgi:hypothetical protein
VTAEIGPGPEINFLFISDFKSLATGVDKMKGKFNVKLAALCAILSVMLIAPALVQAKDEKGEEYYKEHKAQIIKQLKLAPDKEKTVLAVEDKYSAKRQELIAGLKKSTEELQGALKVGTPDEAKIKELVTALTTGQDSLFNSFKSQRDEEMALSGVKAGVD